MVFFLEVNRNNCQICDLNISSFLFSAANPLNTISFQILIKKNYWLSSTDKICTILIAINTWQKISDNTWQNLKINIFGTINSF